MKTWQSVSAQGLLGVTQAANLSIGDKLASPTGQLIISTVIAIIQMWLTKKAQEKNPDGTPASVAYVSPEQKLIDERIRDLR